jgi:hypothetical protein
MQRIVFRPTAETFGVPEPPIPDGTIVILVQAGAASLGRYEAPTPPDVRWPAFDHPVNAESLAGEALAAVLAEHPEIDADGPALVFVCPEALAARAIWGGPPRGPSPAS